jgi:hypothetical protein
MLGVLDCLTRRAVWAGPSRITDGVALLALLGSLAAPCVGLASSPLHELVLVEEEQRPSTNGGQQQLGDSDGEEDVSSDSSEDELPRALRVLKSVAGATLETAVVVHSEDDTTSPDFGLPARPVQFTSTHFGFQAELAIFGFRYLVADVSQSRNAATAGGDELTRGSLFEVHTAPVLRLRPLFGDKPPPFPVWMLFAFNRYRVRSFEGPEASIREESAYAFLVLGYQYRRHRYEVDGVEVESQSLEAGILMREMLRTSLPEMLLFAARHPDLMWEEGGVPRLGRHTQGIVVPYPGLDLFVGSIDIDVDDRSGSSLESLDDEPTDDTSLSASGPGLGLSPGLFALFAYDRQGFSAAVHLSTYYEWRWQSLSGTGFDGESFEVSTKGKGWGLNFGLTGGF